MAYLLLLLGIYFDLALIVLGFVLLVAEALLPSFGALGVGGTIAFVIGSVMLINTDMPGFGIPIGLIASVAVLNVLLVLVAASVRILREYGRGVVFQLSRFWKVKDPGLVILIPGIQQMVRVDLRTVVMDVPAQDMITRDTVSVKVKAVVW